MLATIGDEYLISGCLKSAVAQSLDCNRFAQFGKSGRWRITMHLWVTTRLDGGFNNVLWGWEVGFAGTETNDVFTSRFEGLGFGIDGQCGRFGDSRETRRCALALG